ncbi:MAG: MBL fold metallo-hydrolase, partial [Eubacteriales bacterium]|nr:MBL fold metallo-hydrolase [Eubacteriales bacterium]
MKIVVLMEDTASDPRFACEHGLSFYIETGDRRLLFDMGQTDLFLRNARTLGIDLAAVDTAFLSHGHYDHGGGLAAFLQVNDHAPVYVHERAFEPHFSRKPGGIRAIGLDRALADSPRLRYTTGVTQIDEQLTLLADIPDAVCAPQSGRVLLEQWAGTLAPDRFSHEQSLLV